ncbi:MAG: hypothetical protein LBK82_02900 [Planctomycetaceae bacterium]|jgi:hypothetical protein|nr:hypothetical protein [Planctomycetaceae bacterium]
MNFKNIFVVLFILFMVFSTSKAEETAVSVVEINGKIVAPSHGSATGTWFYHSGETQLLLLGHALPEPHYRITAVLNPNDRIKIRNTETVLLEWEASGEQKIIDTKTTLPLDPQRRSLNFEPTECSPNLHPALETALIEHDWKMQDGIGTPLESRTFKEAIERIIPQIESLLNDLTSHNVVTDILLKRFQILKNETTFDENHWLLLHRLRREMVLSNPLFNTGQLLFAKHVPSAMSHQLTQVYGYAARPGGGLFVLESPGHSMRVRSLTDGKFPHGNFMQPEIRYDGGKIYFAFCEAATSPKQWRDPETMNRHYHLYEMNTDGSGLRQLTEGQYDDFNPTPLPDGKLIFVSTRRGGFHRCGSGPCNVYTLTTLDLNNNNNNDNNKPQTISFHETNEWDPVILNDGRVLYTRWDYVDRDAVFYQQLWTVRQDGTNVRIYYGNNTFVPCGTWEARPIPNSDKTMATAAPHHGMTAGSVILIDPSRGVDGNEPITRLTPDARFPECEAVLAHGIALPEASGFDSPVRAYWDALNRSDRPGNRVLEPTEQERRFPGHCYKSPLPLSETYFIVSYSFDQLRGEPGPNIPNMFGIYFADAFGNKELIYRDPNISSVWAKPLAARPAPPVLNSGTNESEATGTFYLQNVYESWLKFPEGDENKITALRLVQVLPKTTPNANNPMVGAANASPGKQVLGTIPVEEDGSAYFEVPAKIPLLFQALDSKGRAVQTMRSLTYLQPGEKTSCIGCHENRMQTLTPNTVSLAMKRLPSTIVPGPDGSRPFSYPILVQPVLNRHCVSCHNTGKTEKEHGNIILTGEPERHFSRSYNALINRVAYTAWGMSYGNYEPATEPNQFGARGSSLTKLLDNGHYNVQLSEDDWNRLNTWMDANALFYGTFEPKDQALQQRGERITAPALE